MSVCESVRKRVCVRCERRAEGECVREGVSVSGVRRRQEVLALAKVVWGARGDEVLAGGKQRG